MPSGHLKLNIDSAVATITLDRPKADNSFDQWMAGTLKDACERINREDDIRVAIILGAGAVFCKGDESHSEPAIAELVATITKPVIACMNGDAFGAGLELSLACDIRLAADTARFAMPSLTAGEMPWNGGTQRLPRLIGRSKAMEMLLLGCIVDAVEAERTGLVTRVFPSAEVVSEARRLALQMAAMAPYSLRFAKEAINKGMDMTLDQGLRLEADLYFLMHTTRDRVEGITSFLQKRTPHFEGE